MLLLIKVYCRQLIEISRGHKIIVCDGRHMIVCWCCGVSGVHFEVPAMENEKTDERHNIAIRDQIVNELILQPFFQVIEQVIVPKEPGKVAQLEEKQG